MTTFPTPDFKLSLSALADTVPLRRVGTQEVCFSCKASPKLTYGPQPVFLRPNSKDMAGAILFMASRAGAYVNGAVWLVDGGRAGSFPSTY